MTGQTINVFSIEDSPEDAWSLARNLPRFDKGHRAARGTYLGRVGAGAA